MTEADRTMARQIDSCGNTVSGLGEHDLANRLWALAGRLRRRAADEYVARLDAVVAPFCPSECDGDCPALCHERHKPLSKQDHYCCPDCRMTSFNPNAVINRYCGNCHKFEEGG